MRPTYQYMSESDTMILNLKDDILEDHGSSVYKNDTLSTVQYGSLTTSKIFGKSFLKRKDFHMIKL